MDNREYRCLGKAQSFKIEDFQKATNKVNKLEPIAIELQVFPEGYNMIQYNTEKISLFLEYEFLKRKRECMSPFYGIRIVVISNKDDVKMNKNQGKVIYSDGSDEIIDIYKESENS